MSDHSGAEAAAAAVGAGSAGVAVRECESCGAAFLLALASIVHSPRWTLLFWAGGPFTSQGWSLPVQSAKLAIAFRWTRNRCVTHGTKHCHSRLPHVPCAAAGLADAMMSRFARGRARSLNRGCLGSD